MRLDLTLSLTNPSLGMTRFCKSVGKNKETFASPVKMLRQDLQVLVNNLEYCHQEKIKMLQD